MKTLITSFLCATIMGAAVAKPHEDKENVKIRTQVEATSESKVWIGVEKPTDLPVELMLMDQNYRVIFRQFYKNGGTAMVQKLDAKNLMDGQYTLFIRCGKQVIKKTLDVSSSRVQAIEIQ